ncbi:MAG: hypothetical protein BVN32_12445 [Proteobacteria bacterium ST_bin14]|nr:MAG: hypothetical protein BVN32_12445 [Proteobacteria bacterium ST_bin14]
MKYQFSILNLSIRIYNRVTLEKGVTDILEGMGEGWTAQAIADELIPAFRCSFARADAVSANVFPYDPI